VFLMIAGVGLFGTLSGFVASWFLAPVHRQQGNDLERLRNEIEMLRRTIDSRTTAG
jgi:voltage-gated potassium channel